MPNGVAVVLSFVDPRHAAIKLAIVDGPQITASEVAFPLRGTPAKSGEKMTVIVVLHGSGGVVDVLSPQPRIVYSRALNDVEIVNVVDDVRTWGGS